MLWAHAFAADLAALGGSAWRGLRRLALRPVQGRFYRFKDHRRDPARGRKAGAQKKGASWRPSMKLA